MIFSFDLSKYVEKIKISYCACFNINCTVSNFNKIFFAYKKKQHYDFDLGTFKNDIALIRLDRDVVKSEKNGFACLTKSTQVTPGDSVSAVGWGYTEFSRNQGFFLLILY